MLQIFFLEINSEIDPLNAIVRLERDGKFTCTATVISPTYAVTAAHCLVDKRGMMYRRILYIKPNKNLAPVLIEPVEAIPFGVNKEADYGLLIGDFSYFPRAAIAYKTSMVFAEGLNSFYIYCGFPYGEESLLCGTITQTQAPYFGFIRTNALLFSGMSGGPVFNERNEVVGVNSAIGNGFSVVAPLVGMFDVLGVKVVK